MTQQLQMPLIATTIHPVIVPTTEVDHGAEYCELEPVYWDGQSWEVLEWNFEHNCFVLLSDKDWETLQRDPHSDLLRDDILKLLWEEKK